MAVATRGREAFWKGGQDRNLRFEAMRAYLLSLGFKERIRGSHHIYTMPGVPEILNLQPQGSKCKPYQVKQVRKVLTRLGLR